MGEAGTLHDSARMIFASGMLTGLSVAAASWPFEKKMQVALNIFQRSSSGQISQCFRLGALDNCAARRCYMRNGQPGCAPDWPLSTADRV